MTDIVRWYAGHFVPSDKPEWWDEASESHWHPKQPRVIYGVSTDAPHVALFSHPGGHFIAEFWERDGCDLEVWLPSNADLLDMLTSGRVANWIGLPHA